MTKETELSSFGWNRYQQLPRSRDWTSPPNADTRRQKRWDGSLKWEAREGDVHTSRALPFKTLLHLHLWAPLL